MKQSERLKMTNVDVNKALIFANFRLKDSDGSVKRQKRTAMSDFCSPSIRSLKRENDWKAKPSFSFFLLCLFSHGKQRNISCSLSTLI